MNNSPEPINPPMNFALKSHLSAFTFRCWPFAIPMLAVLLFSSSAAALVMREEAGPEPIIVQIKESLRLSDDLDDSLSDLAQLEQEAGVNVGKWWAGAKLLQLVVFSKETTEEQALEIIDALQESAAVARVVPVSAFNLEFKPGDFARAYTPSQEIPEAALRGLDAEALSRPATDQIDLEEAMNLPHVPNQIIVGWKPQYAWRADQTGFRQDLNDFHYLARTHVVRETTPAPTELIQVIEFDDPETSLFDKLKEYAESPWVDYVQPNFIYSPVAVTPNDPFYTNPGQPNLAQISAPDAWDPLLGGTTGNHSVVVAVADSGANVLHPDFRDRLSPGRYNFVNNNTDVTDDYYPYYHGSNVAGILGAQGNNTDFMSGVAWDVSLLILKVIAGTGEGTSERYVRGIDYAYSPNGNPPAIAINCSFAFSPASFVDKFLASAVKRARTNNMVVVAAAGNHGVNSDEPGKLVSPASIPWDNVIAVGAVRANDTKPNYSNKGIYRVELGAPGGEDPVGLNIVGILGLSREPNDDPPYTRLSGTSMAAPHVTGALALVKSKYPWEDYAGIRDRVLMGTDDVGPLTTQFRTGGRLNLKKALKPRTLIKNLSTRARVESGDRIVIGGFVIRGNTCPGNTPCEGLKVVIRGRGPTLPAELSPLPDPKLRLNNSNGVEIFANNDWQDDATQAAELTALGLAPTNEHEAAMVRTLQPGSYTVFLESQDTQQGIALFEIYEIRGSTSEKTRLVNLSTRCVVGSGNNVAIAGTILQNPGQTLEQSSSGFPKRRILACARGPSLERFGLSPTLPDPKLDFHGSGGLIVSNNQWQDIDTSASKGLEDKLVASLFMPSPNLPVPDQYLNDSAVWPTLEPGSYTAILSDAGSGSGIALIEFYEF
jgi:subtilisin family serine protease